MSNPDDILIDLDRAYMLGLIDHLSRPILRVNEREYGYYINPEVVINTNQSLYLEGALSYFLENHAISFQNMKSKSSHFFKIAKKSSIEKLAKLVDGELLQTAEQFSFLNNFLDTFENSSMREDQSKVLGLFEAWANINPQWRSDKKYTPDYLKNNHPRDIDPVDVEVSPPNYRPKIDTDYIAGMFDAVGNIGLSVKESSSQPTGYGISVSSKISLRYPNIRIEPHLELFFQDTNITTDLQNRNNQLELAISDPLSLTEFIDLIYEYSLLNIDIFEAFRLFIIPAIIENQHSTKEGMIEIIEVYDAVKRDKTDRLYTANYFRNLWG
jgi:hypothetical protein